MYDQMANVEANVEAVLGRIQAWAPPAVLSPSPPTSPISCKAGLFMDFMLICVQSDDRVGGGRFRPY